MPLPPREVLHFTKQAMQTEVRIMARFVPKEKLSKKAQKELNRQRRVTWEFSPVTKTVESRKIYSRRKNSYDRHEDYGMGVFHCINTSVSSLPPFSKGKRKLDIIPLLDRVTDRSL